MKIWVYWLLQGAFIEHCQILQKLGVEAREVRLPGQLAATGRPDYTGWRKHHYLEVDARLWAFSRR